MITETQQLGNYLETFGRARKSAAGRNSAWLETLRERAFARFCEKGFPTTKDEDWRFTSVAAVAQTRYALGGGDGARVSAQVLAPYELAGAACRLVFVNGRYAPELSRTDGLPKGVTAGSLAEQLNRDAAALEPYLGRFLNIERDPFCALNTAFLDDGAWVRVGRGVVAEAPLHLLFASVTGGEAVMSHPRNLIVAEEASELTVVEDYVSLDEGTAFCNAATELVAGDGAVVSHYMIERERGQAANFSTLRIEQGRSANVASHSVLAGGMLVRNNVHPVLAGEGGECLINGLFVGDGRQHLDNYMLVEHARAHCGSRQFYNGILDGQARGVFHGRIVVHPGAQKTDAKQTNRNLLLSDDARVDTKPQLEIYADDVKCTHGATIGQIEEQGLFYLRSRGIDEAAARRILLMAFANECLDRMKEGPARTHAEEVIAQRLEELGAVRAGSARSQGAAG